MSSLIVTNAGSLNLILISSCSFGSTNSPQWGVTDILFCNISKIGDQFQSLITPLVFTVAVTKMLKKIADFSNYFLEKISVYLLK